MIWIWSLAMLIISCAPLYWFVLRPHFKLRKKIFLPERIEDLKKHKEILEKLNKCIISEQDRITNEKALFQLNNKLLKLERKLKR